MNQNNVPSAYAVIHLLDKDENVLATQEKFVSQGSGVYRHISTEVEVVDRNTKYAVLYVANESPIDVYFDDLELKHERLVWQENSYYPFGLGIKPLDREDENSHRFKYNGKELEEETGLLDYHARQMDGQLGRFMSIDPHAENYYKISSFVYVANNPLIFIDPDGKDIKNGHTNALQGARSSVRNLEKMLSDLQEREANGEDVGGDVYEIKKRLKGAQKSLETIQTKYNETEKYLTLIKLVDRELYDQMDNIKDRNGNTVDIYVRGEYDLGNNGTKGMSNVPDKVKDNDPDKYYSARGDNTAEVVFKLTSNQTTSVKLLVHEFGHLKYQIPNVATYKNLYDRLYSQYPQTSLKRGHAPDDPSNQSVKATFDSFHDKWRNYEKSEKEKRKKKKKN